MITLMHVLQVEYGSLRSIRCQWKFDQSDPGVSSDVGHCAQRLLKSVHVPLDFAANLGMDRLNSHVPLPTSPFIMPVQSVT